MTDIERWEGVLAGDFYNREARIALMDLYPAAGRWRELAELYDYEVGTAELDGQMRVYLAKLVEVYRDRLGDHVRAADAQKRLEALK